MGVEAWLVVAAVVVLAWAYSRWRHSYWSSRGVSSPPPLPFIGHLHWSIIVSRTFWEYYEKAYIKYGGSSFCGLYEGFKPILMVGDPELLKLILIKDFDHFSNRRNFDFGDNKEVLFSEMLTMKNGQEWKSLRGIMTPVFTSGKIKSMFPVVCDKADALVNFSLQEATQKPHVDLKDNFGRYTMSTIASCAFGIECNSFGDETDEFSRQAKLFFTPTLIKSIFGTLFMLSPKAFWLLGINANPPEILFFNDVVRKTVAAREAGGTARGDFLDLLLEAKRNSNSPNSKLVMSELCLVGQCILFLIAGYDTTASTLAFASFLLAKHKDQQQRLREEVQEIVGKDGELTYQGIMEAKLLDACIMETLRLYPPAPLGERICSKTYKLPGTELTLKPGDVVQIPIWSIHHDPRHWPNPEEFQPDRFLPQNKGNIPSCTHLPFGMGPRNCIAMRFALLEAKVALTKLILAAEIELVPGQEQLVLEGSSGVIRPKGSLNLLLKPLKEH